MVWDRVNRGDSIHPLGKRDFRYTDNRQTGWDWPPWPGRSGGNPHTYISLPARNRNLERTWNRQDADATHRDDLSRESSAFPRGADIHRRGRGRDYSSPELRSLDRDERPLTADKLPDGILAEAP